MVNFVTTKTIQSLSTEDICVLVLVINFWIRFKVTKRHRDVDKPIVLNIHTLIQHLLNYANLTSGLPGLFLDIFLSDCP